MILLIRFLSENRGLSFGTYLSLADVNKKRQIEEDSSGTYSGLCGYCVILAQRKNCGARETSVALQWPRE
jgi:hypothetical protein